MDLDTSTLVAKVNAQSLLNIKLGGNQNKNYSKNKNYPFDSNIENEFDNEDEFLDQDYIVDPKTTSSVETLPETNADFAATGDTDFRRINFNESSLSGDQTDYPFDNYNIELNQYCETEVTDLIDDSILNDKDYRHVLLHPNENISRNEHVLKYQNLVSSASSVGAELISPESILEENSELNNSQEQPDYNALNEFLNIPLTEHEDIEPHFIAGPFTSSEDKLDSKEDHIDSSEMGIENTW